jgi:paraquat-inducible protein A
MTTHGKAVTAAVRCSACELQCTVPRLDAGQVGRCPRCNAVLHDRKPDSLARTTALLIGAAVCYVPANLLPVMIVAGPHGSSADTILSGVQSMFRAGWWVIGCLIFVASITVPLLKLVSLTFLVISVRRRSSWKPRDRTELYRAVEIIGRWSMLDMFVVSLTVALVQLGVVANVQPAIGATFFAAVVVLTMFAAQNFDPRLIWDEMEDEP